MSNQDLDPARAALLADSGNLLVLGGPGAGKTTIALRKADYEGQPGNLKLAQKILFLSFARPTIGRVIQQVGKILGRNARQMLEINTYHGFIWKLLRSHGHLLRDRRITLLPPPQAASRLSDIAGNPARDAEKRRLFDEEAILHFDLFASAAHELLSRSQALSRILGDAYPVIILDEFQDTNADEWAFIKTLGKHSRLIALADAEQRIYEFRGADPKRIGEFTAAFQPTVYDFGNENYRSDGKDITAFGNDLLAGTNKGKTYKNVSVQGYGFYRGRNAMFPFKCEVIRRLRSLHKSIPENWSLAVLVPTKRLMLGVSDYLGGDDDELPALQHDVALDAEAPALAALIIATLLEGGASAADISQHLIKNLCHHIRGRRGNDSTPQGELLLVGALGEYLKSGKVRGQKRIRIIDGASSIAGARMNMVLSGNPAEDWLAVRALFEQSDIGEYGQVAEDAKYLRLLRRGTNLRSRLSDLWRLNSNYKGAAAAVNEALLQEHFSAALRDWRGIHVMTIHKSKGKEFSEVVIYEGLHHGRIVARGAPERQVAQARLALRVAVTRAMNHTTILTPANDRCIFL